MLTENSYLGLLTQAQAKLFGSGFENKLLGANCAVASQIEETKEFKCTAPQIPSSNVGRPRTTLLEPNSKQPVQRFDFPPLPMSCEQTTHDYCLGRFIRCICLYLA